MSIFKKIHYYRLLAEAEGLQHKMIELEKFCESGDYITLSVWHRADVNRQSHAMRLYLDALQSRIKDLGKDIDK